MKNFLQVGGAVSVPAPRAILSGGLVVVGMLAGVAQHSAASGAAVEIQTTGCFELQKTSAQAWAVGDPIYAIPATGICTTTKAGNLFIGVAIEAATASALSGKLRLNGSAPAALST